MTETNSQSEANENSQRPLTEKIPPCEVAVIFSLGIEAKGLVERLSDVVSSHCNSYVERAGYLRKSRVVVAEVGSGGKKAASATEDVIAIHKPAWVVSAGFASGLDENLQRHDILMADEIIDVDGNRLSVGFNMDPQVVESTPGLRVGPLISVDHIVCEPEEKRELGKNHGALACDVESMAVANVCRQAKVRFMSVRGISDAVDEQLSHQVQTLLRQDSIAGKLGAAAATLFRRPSSFKQLWAQKKQAQETSEHLGKFLLGVIRQLVSSSESESRSGES